MMQCATHQFLGWQIQVRDPETTTPPETGATTVTIAITDPTGTTEATQETTGTGPTDITTVPPGKNYAPMIMKCVCEHAEMCMCAGG